MNNLHEYTNWLQEKNLAPKTINSYRQTIGYFGQLPFTTENIVDFIKKLVQKREPATCQLYVTVLKSYAKFSQVQIDWERIDKLVPTRMKKFFTTIDQAELIKLKQVKFEKNNWLHERNNLILDFLFYSGLRVSELVNIRHRDWQDNSLRIHGKGNKIRYVFIPDFLVKHIKFGSPEYLFTDTQGQKIDAPRIRAIVRQRTQLAGINKWVSPHTFRRSFATLLYNKDVKINTISKLLGHSSIETTMGYIHNDYNTLYQDYSKLWLNPSPGGIHA